MLRAVRLRSNYLLPVVLLLAGGASQQACSCEGAEDSAFDDGTTGGDGGGDDVEGPGTLNPNPGGDSGSGTLVQGQLTVDPTTSTINTTVTNGVAAPNPATVKFTAKVAGQTVTQSVVWFIDRGELGSVASDGTFTPSNKASGEATVHAKYGDREATAKIQVNTTTSQNGRPTDPAETALNPNDPGGAGGVGGELLGTTPVSDGDKAKLLGVADGTDATFKFTYPYDKTVWPRKIAAPVMMWDAAQDAKAVYVHIKQPGFEYQGFFSYTGVTPIGPGAQKRIRIAQDTWKQFTNANGGAAGDDVTVEVKILGADDKVYGPIKETWKIAPGILAGSIYYNSYDSELTGNGDEMGGVLRINSRNPQPERAVPGQAGKCHTCHSLSADGSTLFAQDGKFDNSTYTPALDDPPPRLHDCAFNPAPCSNDRQKGHSYANGASYNLRSTDANRGRIAYTASFPDGGVPAGSEKDRLFVWAGAYPDGSFALASYGFANETWLAADGATKLYKKSDGSVRASNIADVAKVTVTPSFSADGKKVAFGYWKDATTDTDLTKKIAVVDHGCGAAAGSVACTGNSNFTGLRELYTAEAGYNYVAWPSFLPQGEAVVFQKQVGPGCDYCDFVINAPTYRYNQRLTTWAKSQAELWIVRDATDKRPTALNALIGRTSTGESYLPEHVSQDRAGDTLTPARTWDDTKMNYMPTVNPVPSGGYYWVVFTSRRRYGNLIHENPFARNPAAQKEHDDSHIGSKHKKLWVAAVDIQTGEIDPSHPGFYLPGQELAAGNSRGFWVVDPCKADGNSCDTGDECCGGFCRPTDPLVPDGPRTCQAKPPASCAQEFEKCVVASDCCATSPPLDCIGGRCGRRVPK